MPTIREIESLLKEIEELKNDKARAEERISQTGKGGKPSQAKIDKLISEERRLEKEYSTLMEEISHEINQRQADG